MGAVSYGIADIPTKRAVEALQRQIDALKKQVAAPRATVAASSSSDIPEEITERIDEIAGQVEEVGSGLATANGRIANVELAVGGMKLSVKSASAAWTPTETGGSVGYARPQIALEQGETVLGLVGYNAASSQAIVVRLDVNASTGVVTVGIRMNDGSSPSFSPTVYALVGKGGIVS